LINTVLLYIKTVFFQPTGTCHDGYKIRVAHALKALPAIAQAFRLGMLSYSKLRALVRVADRSNEDELLTFALKTTAARVEECCRELRCGITDSTVEANNAHARR